MLCLRSVLPSLSDTESQIANFILDNPEETSALTVRQLAQRTFSSPSSVVRVWRQIGFSGYKELRWALILEVAALGEGGHHAEQEITPGDSIPEVIEKITCKNVQCLIDTSRLLSPEVLNACVQLLAQADRVLLFGIGASLCAARDAYLKFLRLNKTCIINDDWHSQLLQARNSSARDAALVFSYSGQTVEMIECMKAMKENGTPIIAITRYYPSDVAQLADHVLYIAANETLFRSGAMSSRLSQLNVIDILYTIYASLDYEKNVCRLTRTHILKPEKAEGDGGEDN